MRYIIGTRGSRLALAQAEYVGERLTRAYPAHTFAIRTIRTAGDRILDKPIAKLGEKGVFVKEIEEGLISKKVDIGVHSMKDMPVDPAFGLVFAKAWEREDPRDALILREKKSLDELREGAVIGTGSLRREFQLKRLRPDLRFVPIRGNVDTRLEKMQKERLDGIVLAAAGLHRLNLRHVITQYLAAEDVIPAPAQGILALEIRKGDTGLLAMLNALCDADAVCAAEAERGFLREMGGGCHLPVGAFCKRFSDESFSLLAVYGDSAGRLAYTSVSDSDPSRLSKLAALDIRRQCAGKVWLVGAGPGDPGLITAKGLNVLQRTECVIYDRLIPSELLCEAPAGCERIYVGKENRRHTMEQEEINRLMVRKSMEYRTVVRLKGGDAYVFGRGSEEGIFLREHGVPFEVIPGVTSAIAAPACAGIPVTHRGIASGFHVVTAQSRENTLSEIDFAALAKGRDTCVFLMGLSRLEEIADRLICAGMPPATEAAVISCAGTLRQRVCVSDLAHIAKQVQQEKLTSPAVIVVGRVVALRAALGAAKLLPLSKKRYLLPKIGSKETKLAELLRGQGAFVREIQVGEIVRIPGRFAKEELLGADWLVFTSKNGVEAFFCDLADKELDLRLLAGCRIAAVGEKTAKRLREYGIYADLTPEASDSEALGEALRERVGAGECVWHLKAKHADRHLAKLLAGRCRLKELTVYENKAVTPDFGQEEDIGQYDGVLATCASSAERIWDALKEKALQELTFYSIGRKTTDCLRSLGVKEVREAKRASYEGMTELLRRDSGCKIGDQNGVNIGT